MKMEALEETKILVEYGGLEVNGGLEEMETEALEETKTLGADGGPETLKAETKETVMSWRI